MAQEVLSVTLANFEQTVIQCKVPVVLGFWSMDYPGSQRLLTTLQSLADSYDGAVQCGSIDVGSQPDLAAQLGIGGMPCVMILVRGRLCEHVGGALPPSYYKCLLKRLLPEEKRGKKKIKV